MKINVTRKQLKLQTTKTTDVFCTMQCTNVPLGHTQDIRLSGAYHYVTLQSS